MSQARNEPSPCPWAVGAPADYLAYHDDEWGMPVADDIRLFEKLCLEGFQAGLSWLTILRKRPAFRAAFAGFDFHQVAGFGPSDVARLLDDPGIVRHRGKIEATISNARATLELVSRHGSLGAFIWAYEPDPASRPEVVTAEVLSGLKTSPAATALSRDLKRAGFRFVGPTTMYAFCQAMGLVNDHVVGCPAGSRVAAARGTFSRPGSSC